MITSRHNPEIQRIRRLAASARHRAEAGLFLVEGARFIELGIEAGARPEALYRAEPSTQPGEIERIERTLGRGATAVAHEVLSWAANVESGIGAVALFPFTPRPVSGAEWRLDRALVLEDVADPGNLGAAIRSAAAAGVEAVVLAGACADWTNPKAVRASAGTVFSVRMLEAASVGEALDCLGLPGIGAEARAERSLFGFAAPDRHAVVVGHETRGLSEAARAACTELLRIPMAAPVESLNVAVACALFVYVLGPAGAPGTGEAEAADDGPHTDLAP